MIETGEKWVKRLMTWVCVFVIRAAFVSSPFQIPSAFFFVSSFFPIVEGRGNHFFRGSNAWILIEEKGRNCNSRSWTVWILSEKCLFASVNRICVFQVFKRLCCNSNWRIWKYGRYNDTISSSNVSILFKIAPKLRREKIRGLFINIVKKKFNGSVNLRVTWPAKMKLVYH